MLVQKPPYILSQISFVSVPHICCRRLFLTVSTLPLSPLSHISADTIVRLHTLPHSLYYISTMPHLCHHHCHNYPLSRLQSLPHYFTSSPCCSLDFSPPILSFYHTSNATISIVTSYLLRHTHHPLHLFWDYNSPPILINHHFTVLIVFCLFPPPT